MLYELINSKNQTSVTDDSDDYKRGRVTITIQLCPDERWTLVSIST